MARYVVYYAFDAATQAALLAVQQRMVKELPFLQGKTGKMKPHISLLVLDAEDEHTLLKAFNRVSKEAKGFALTLDRLETFTGKQNVLFLAPESCPQLQQLAASCHERFWHVGEYVDPYQQLEAFTPHVTLAKRLAASELKASCKLAEAHIRPIAAQVTTLGVIDVKRPHEPLREVGLNRKAE